jgi:hypothetical protein
MSEETRPTSAPTSGVQKSTRFIVAMQRTLLNSIRYLQGKHLLDKLLLFMNEEAATVRLPRDDVGHPIVLELG